MKEYAISYYFSDPIPGKIYTAWYNASSEAEARQLFRNHFKTARILKVEANEISKLK